MWLRYWPSNDVLPHYRTSGTATGHTLDTQRQPMDRIYDCGFDPRGKTLKQCVDHWESCGKLQCQAKALNWFDLKNELLRTWRRFR